MNLSDLRSYITARIYTNNAKAITAAKHQEALLAVADHVIYTAPDSEIDSLITPGIYKAGSDYLIVSGSSNGTGIIQYHLNNWPMRWRKLGNSWSDWMWVSPGDYSTIDQLIGRKWTTGAYVRDMVINYSAGISNNSTVAISSYFNTYKIIDMTGTLTFNSRRYSIGATGIALYQSGSNLYLNNTTGYAVTDVSVITKFIYVGSSGGGSGTGTTTDSGTTTAEPGTTTAH
jgi:hypothetical protein